MSNNDYLGKTVDQKYKIVRLMDEGDTGAIFKGKDLSSGAQVAIKFLYAGLTTNVEFVKRFFREARAAAELQHKNIIKLLDVGIFEDKVPFLVLEYLEGECLSDLLQRKERLSVSSALGIIEPILSAIGAMHDKGIVHRDITPDHVFLVHVAGKPVHVKLIDFGLSKFTETSEEANLTMFGDSLGDIGYISPEQIKDPSTVDHRTDIYAAATILYEMLAGRLPFGDVPATQRLTHKLTKAPKPVRTLERSVPRELDRLISRSLSIEMNARPSSAGQMLKILSRIEEYEKRASGLSRCAEGVSHLTVAGGGHSVVMQEEGKTHGRHSSHGLSSYWRWLTGTLPGRVSAVAAMLVFLGGIAIFFLSGGDEDERPDAIGAPIGGSAPAEAKPAPVSMPAKPQDVQIEVRGLPSGAQIYYDGAPIPVNPFRVARKEVIVPLKIEADGYNVYHMSLVPVEDQVVKVKMKLYEAPTAHPEDTEAFEEEAFQEPSEPATKRKEPSRARKARPSVNHAASSDSDKTTKAEFKTLKKGVKISSEFE